MYGSISMEVLEMEVFFMWSRISRVLSFQNCALKPFDVRLPCLNFRQNGPPHASEFVLKHRRQNFSNFAKKKSLKKVPQCDNRYYN